MSVYLPETNEIYCAKTKEYFNEVMSSYSNGNYRSTVVMLYSTVICDILLKLQELKDMYNDSGAKNILKEVEKAQKESANKSSWEKELLEMVRDKTNLIDSKTFSDLSHLYDDRCFSAHPAVNEDFELYTPSQETTIAHIKNALNGVLIKPPIFINNVIDMLTNDLKERGEILLNESSEFARYLRNKYYDKMSNTMKLKTVKTLWKFCFKLVDDENCKSNRKINRCALTELILLIPQEVKQDITDHKESYTVAREKDCEFQLSVLLSRIPELYGVLDESVKLQLDSFINDNCDVKWGAWFKFNNLKEHMDFLYKTSNSINPIFSNAKYALNHYKKLGEANRLLEFFIYMYSNSDCFNAADNCFDNLIGPFIEEFSREQIIKIIQSTDENRQIHNRNKSRLANSIIIKNTHKLLGDDFDYSQYPNFKFDEKALNSTEDTDYGD